MHRRRNSQGYLLVAGLTATSMLSGCDKSSKPTDTVQWSNAPGTKGLINLDAVKQAFNKDPDVAKFEDRVNEIFEGDNLVTCGSKIIDGGFLLTATEDLDADGKLSPKDEELFTLTVAKGRATLQGKGVNSYYEESWPYDPPKKEEYTRSRSSGYYHRPYFHYWYWGRGWGGYYTPRSRYNSMSLHRRGFRSSSAYSSQINNNMGFEKRMDSKHGSGFRNSVRTDSPVRSSYIKQKTSDPAFRESLKTRKGGAAWSTRATSTKSSSFRSAVNPPKSTRSVSSSSRSRGFGGFRSSSGFGI